MALALIAIALAYAFDFANGFHDTANAVATVIYTRAMKSRNAIIMSGLLNFLGAVVVGTAVAMVITEVVPADVVTMKLILAALVAGLMWNLGTWYYGLPVSSSHTLVGSLVGAGLAANWISGVQWGSLTKIILSLLISPVLGIVLGWMVTRMTLPLAGRRASGKRSGADHPRLLRWMTILSGAAVSFSHGSNDGQKTMGVITLVLIAEFGRSQSAGVPFWVVVTAAAAIGLGTMIGGWRIIRTVGEKISQVGITPVQGFAAQLSAALIILIGSRVGAPVSTTHVLSSAVAGSTIGEHTRQGLNFKVASNIFLAWIVTLPATASMAAVVYLLFGLL
ncbi:MAG TPA: anion permease [Rubrobacter sp.]|nr:anion permease [Rubrobacter sp.]